MKGIGFAIKTEAKPERPIPDKAILWATQNGDSSYFPEIADIELRNFIDQPKPLIAFGKAVSQAQERVWVIDPYFLKPTDNDDEKKANHSRQKRINQILLWMPETMQANDIRFLTTSHNTVDNDLAKQFQEHAEIINAYRTKGTTLCVIELRCTLTQNFDYVHDRFAIIDDELWHFGATVGGFHSKVSAATRGWRASDHGAEEFFELAWTRSAKSIKGKQK